MAREERLGVRSLGDQAEHLVDDAVLGEDIPLGDPLDLAFAEPVPRFIPLDGPLRRGACSKALPRVPAAYYKPMILFDDIIQILAWPEETGLGEDPLRLKGLKGGWIRSVLVHSAPTGCEHMCGLEPLAEEALGRIGIAARTQQKIEGLPLGIAA